MAKIGIIAAKQPALEVRIGIRPPVSADDTPRAGRDGPCLIEIPDVRQRDHYSCGAAVTLSCTWYRNVGFVPKSNSDADVKAALDATKRALGTNAKESTHPEAIIKFLKSLRLKVEAADNMTLDDLCECYDEGHPVICPVQDYGPALPAEARFAYGHYLAVIGPDVPCGYVACQDPSEDNVVGDSGSVQKPGRILVDSGDWMRLWHDKAAPGRKDAQGRKFVRYGIAVGEKM